MNALASKAQLRERFGAARKALTAADIATFSDRITNHLLALPELQRAERVAIYLARPHEVQTAACIASLRARGTALCIPTRGQERDAYHFAQLPDDAAALIPGPLGIPQPAQPVWVDPASINLMIVPGVAFAPDGIRLGHGAGIYDRLLAECPGKRCGIAFNCQLAEHLPADSHDVPMDWVVTEFGANATPDLFDQKT